MSIGTSPTQFGKYELMERLGAGGMAIVYRARFTAAPGVIKPVVIKRVLSHYAEDPDFVEMFVQEARISVGLNHGNIVQVFDFGQVDGEYFLAMELVEGQPLSAVLKRAQATGLSKLPAPLAVLIAIEMCKGLHHAHTRTDEAGRPLGLVHRDISPDNVLVSYEGEVKISDFGIAKAHLAGRPVTEAGMVKGKVLYMSPEQMRGEPLDARSDVYAVGVVLYRMLCGRLPVEGSEIEAMQRVVQGQHTHPRQLNPDLDGGLVQILMDSLAIRRDARIRSAEALHQQLSHWLATRAPLFPVHTLKHLLGVLYEQELTALGRTPQLPPKFREQMALWGSSSPPEPTPSRPRQQLRPASRGGQTPKRTSTAASMMAPAATEEQPQLTADAEHARTATDRASVVDDPEATDKAHATGEALAADEPPERDEETGLTLPERVQHFWLWVIGVAVATAVLVKLVWPAIFSAPPLMVRSEPPGALVEVDDTSYGVTPVTVQGIKRSVTHKVELSRPGMQDWGQIFTPGTLPDELTVTLEPVKAAAPRPPPPEPRAPAPPESKPESKPEHKPEDSFAARFGTDTQPARFTLQEKWHSFSPTRRSFQQALEPARAYSVRTSGQYISDAPTPEQDLNQGLSPASFQSSQLYIFLEGDGVPAGERLFTASGAPYDFSGARVLHAFVVTNTSSERNQNRSLTLHVRPRRARKDLSRPVDPKRFAHIVALENRYSVRKLDPRLTYSVEVSAKQGAPSSAVAMLVVPSSEGVRVRVSGHPQGDLHYALQTGSYTVQGARELWFSLPRWEQDGEAEMELSVEPQTVP
ncbi:MAG TPA: serine/threonine-protein kinase [Myxococcaceae bacterium]